MTVPGGCRSQGCRGYLHSRLCFFQFNQAVSPHPSIGDGLKDRDKWVLILGTSIALFQGVYHKQDM